MAKRAQALFNEGLSHEKAIDFESARKTYQEIVDHFETSAVAAKARGRLEDMADLIEEKRIYKRIDLNGRRVLTEIGVNIAESPELMDILMAADAIDFDNETAVFIPLKSDYIEECLSRVPTKLELDPGPNSFGTGATPPFLKRSYDDELRPANRREFEEITRVVAEMSDVVHIFSLPVATDKSISDFEVAQAMESNFVGLKMTATKNMSDEEAAFLRGKAHWLDGTSLITSLAPMGTMIRPFIRSARTGNNLLLLDLTIAGSSGPQSPEALLTQIHAQVIFMMVLAQTLNPGVACVHGGIPGVVEAGGDLSYSSSSQPLINAAMARVNTWITKFPSAQSGGSTSIADVTPEAVSESELSRNTLRKYGVHLLRHAMGALASLNFFSLTKFIEDCERERRAEKIFSDHQEDKGIIPLYFPDDDKAMAGIREIAEKGNPKHADHTLKNVESFMAWEKRINEAARKKLYYPELKDTVIELISKGETVM
jgi:trimethylamine---corrinoid protein Co-methyltransferase